MFDAKELRQVAYNDETLGKVPTIAILKAADEIERQQKLIDEAVYMLLDGRYSKGEIARLLQGVSDQPEK